LSADVAPLRNGSHPALTRAGSRFDRKARTIQKSTAPSTGPKMVAAPPRNVFAFKMQALIVGGVIIAAGGIVTAMGTNVNPNVYARHPRPRGCRG
jgi:hypothetical protein